MAGKGTGTGKRAAKMGGMKVTSGGTTIKNKGKKPRLGNKGARS